MDNKYDTDRDRLAALQTLDRVLKEKKDLADQLAAEIDEMANRLSRQRDEVQRLTAERDRLEIQRVDLDTKLDVEGAKIRDSRMKMNRARNEKEVLALQHQVNVTKEQTKQLEEQIIAVMEGLEELNSKLASTAEALQAFETESSQEIGTRRTRVDALRLEIQGESVHRDSIADGLEIGLRSKYDQLFARRGGTAVVEVRNGTCLGCRVSVPPQLYNELQKYRDIRQCPNCHRILFWRPEPAAEA